MKRLSHATLADASSKATPPPLDPRQLGVGIVHLGVGAFHRAHQVVYTEDAMAATGDTGWGIAGYTQRSTDVRDRLAPQDGLYTLLERGAGAAAPRIVGALREVGLGGQAAARIADPDVRIVTLTVTEKGYRTAAGGGLDLSDADLRADLAAGSPPVTPIAQLVAGLAARAALDAPLTVLCCDNLSDNGHVLRRLVLQFCAAAGRADLATWIGGSVTFPCSMVDRIVPATRDADYAEALGLLGVTDLGVVTAEPFRQWVIEDRFAAGRPEWQAAGVILTGDVRPYEAAKLRLLNAAHSLLAYAGALAGHDTIAEAVADPALAAAARQLMVHDALPTLAAPDGVRLDEYTSQVLARFANPHLGHRTTQVAADGSKKLPIRLLGTARERLAAGAEPRGVAYAVGAWMAYVAAGRSRTGKALPLDDPIAGRLRAAAGGHTEPARLVAALLAVEEVFDPQLATDPVFRALLDDAVGQLLPP